MVDGTSATPPVGAIHDDHVFDGQHWLRMPPPHEHLVQLGLILHRALATSNDHNGFNYARVGINQLTLDGYLDLNDVEEAIVRQYLPKGLPHNE